MDEIMRYLQSTGAQSPVVRFRTLSLRMDLVGLLELTWRMRERRMDPGVCKYSFAALD